ncbi:putative Zn finger protein [Rhodopirellula rubra]|uniref:Putative Zn finger protein n=1 Tax=Aporhodopirellula rubra TaxID=980271 RepID=A0A7W5E6W7_9BACT|nr:putative Zn finger protein [Aporhodopirellula rubra]
MLGYFFYGFKNRRIVCPHCQTTGEVRTKTVLKKRGISGGKATGAILTGGLSLLATGLSRKMKVTEARCGNCGIKWDIN